MRTKPGRRLEPETRRNEILEAALSEAKKSGFHSLSILGVAVKADCSRALIHTYFNTVSQLKRAVMRQAIKNENLLIVAQGLVAGDTTARKAPDWLQQKALESVIH